MQTRALPVLLCLGLSAVATAQGGQPASHAPYGHGCHDVAKESFYSLFANAAAAAAALNGHSLVLTRRPDGYEVANGGGVFRAPAPGAATLPPVDDGQVPITPTSPLPIPGGAAPTLWVHSNGVVATGPGIAGGQWNQPTNDWTPTSRFRGAPDAAFWAWHDWNPAEAGSGHIRVEEATVDGHLRLFVTWDAVESYPVDAANPGTFQFQFDLVTGDVTWVWQSLDADVSSPFGSAHLVGYSPGGASLDPGSTSVPMAAALVLSPDQHALALDAAPAPVSTPVQGTLLCYTVREMPAAVPGSPLRVGFVVLSVGDSDGLDLGYMGAPGCSAWVQSVDIQFPVIGGTPVIPVWFALPPGLPADFEFFAQSLALCQPHSMSPDNVLGVVTSHGVKSRVAAN